MGSLIDKIVGTPLVTESRLIDYWTLNMFVGLDSNRDACELCGRAATDQSGNLEVIIFGDTGLGKTHLLHAVGHEWRKNGKNVVRSGADTFFNEMVWAKRHGSLDQFRSKYRGCDLLLIEHIQFLAPWGGAQTELLTTLEHHRDFGSAVIVDCDADPRASGLLDRPLLEHLSAYQTTEIRNPNLVERKILCREFQNRWSIETLADDVIDFLAMTARRSGRYVEKAMRRISDYAQLKGRPIDMALIREIHNPQLGLSLL